MVTGDGPAISYLIEGADDAPSIVLLHSLATSSEVWEPILPMLTSSYRVIAPDTRGHGASEKAPEVTIDDWAEDIERIMLDTGTDRATFVGVSMGGIQAIAYAAKYRHRVDALVVADSFAALPSQIAQDRIATLTEHAKTTSMPEVAAKYIVDTFRDPDALGAQVVVRVMSQMDLDSYLAAVLTCFAANVEGQLAHITAPTSVLWGDRDHKTPRPLSEAISTGIRNSRFTLIPDAGHLSNVDNPHAFAEALISFFGALPSGPTL
jgi:3-oxoadipate enol-lactonase